MILTLCGLCMNILIHINILMRRSIRKKKRKAKLAPGIGK